MIASSFLKKTCIPNYRFPNLILCTKMKESSSRPILTKVRLLLHLFQGNKSIFTLQYMQNIKVHIINFEINKYKYRWARKETIKSAEYRRCTEIQMNMKK